MVSTDLNHGESFDETDKITFATHQGVAKSFKKSFSKERGGSSSDSHRAGSTTSIDGSTALPANGYFFWHGESEDGSSLNYLKDTAGNVCGSVVDVAEGMVYQIQTELDGSTTVTMTSSNNFDEEEEALGDQDEVGERKLQSSVERDSDGTPVFTIHNPNLSHNVEEQTNNSSRRNLYDDRGGNLDVMVVWTMKAECLHSGLAEGCMVTEATHAAMMTLVELAIEETNAAYNLSGVNTELLLVHAYRHPTYDVHDSLPALIDLRNGDISDVHINRDIYGADIVAMIGAQPSGCGRGYIGPRKAVMFSVTRYSCATGYFSFGHEIGHNLGQSRLYFKWIILIVYILSVRTPEMLSKYSRWEGK